MQAKLHAEEGRDYHPELLIQPEQVAETCGGCVDVGPGSGGYGHPDAADAEAGDSHAEVRGQMRIISIPKCTDNMISNEN